MKIVIILFSPFKNTLKIGNIIQETFISLDCNCVLLDLTGKTWEEIINYDYSTIPKMIY